MTGCSEQEVPFDYNAHIAIKEMLTTQYRTVVEFDGQFQGVDISCCDHCAVEGWVSVGIPFQFIDLTTKELRCYLFRMGVKNIPITDMDDVPQLFEYETMDGEELLCGHCSDEISELEEMED